MPASALTAPTATPNQPVSSIVLTTGSTIQIKAPASKVFAAMTETDAWQKWNSWTTSLTFPEGGSIRTPGSKGTLHTRMEAQNRDYDVPIEILEVSDASASSTTRSGARSGSYVLAWKSLLMPSWFATAERVQIVTPVTQQQPSGEDQDLCELRQWESMSGWGVYLLKWVLGIEKQLIEANVTYAEELAKWVESC